MAKRIFILIIILLVTAWAPQAQTSVPPDTVITLQRIPDAFNNGIDYIVIINSAGAVTFKRFASPFVDKSDWRAQASEPIKSQIPVAKVALLLGEFERIKFFSLKDRYAKTEDGCQRKEFRSEEHTSELQSHVNLVCRLLLEKKNRI